MAIEHKATEHSRNEVMLLCAIIRLAIPPWIVPSTLVSPDTLNNILVNISRYLPENYEWFAGSKFENLYLHYDMVKVAIVGDTHNIRLILNVPLKTANRNFVLYKLIAFPMPVLNNTFVLYKPNYLYFGFNEFQHSYALFTEAEINCCIGGSVAVCPADKAVYTTKVVTCESSLFF
jgi:hypothetical protein